MTPTEPWPLSSTARSLVVVTESKVRAPGRPGREPIHVDGFGRGGWARPYGDAVMARVMGERMVQPGALLLGRRTYEDFVRLARAGPTTPSLRCWTTGTSTSRRGR
jgi:hypothetical protein